MSPRWPDKIIVGLTGNIATGKTAVMKMATERAALTLDADRLVHDILAGDSQAQDQVITAFGASIQTLDGEIDRQKLAEIVFNEPSELRKLEAILHPLVRQRLWQRLETSQETIVFIEAIKLIEGSLASECDQVWVTTCPAELQIERLMSIRGMDRETAELRVRAQPPQELKLAKADVIIDTSLSLQQTRYQFDTAWNGLARFLTAPSSLKTEPEEVKQLEEKREIKSISVQENAPSLSENIDSTAKNHEDTINPTSVKVGDVIVRRARPTDIPAILLLIKRATNGAVQINRGELLLALGDRGYLIGQIGTDISAVMGWSAENLVATIDQIFISPPEAADTTGVVVLREIERTANELINEVMIAFPLEEGQEEVHRLLMDNGFDYVDPDTFPKSWQEAVAESRPDNSAVMVKRLRDTRGVDLQTVSRG